MRGSYTCYIDHLSFPVNFWLGWVVHLRVKRQLNCTLCVSKEHVGAGVMERGSNVLTAIVNAHRNTRMHAKWSLLWSFQSKQEARDLHGWTGGREIYTDGQETSINNYVIPSTKISTTDSTKQLICHQRFGGWGVGERAAEDHYGEKAQSKWKSN